MKFRSVHKWKDVSNSQKLLFFAQHLDELLFEFSLDTYKPSAMNASVLCHEALSTIHNIREGVIAEPNLQHILDELHDQISKDEISKGLIPLDLSYIHDRLKNKAYVFEEKKTLVEMLAVQLELSRYKKRAEVLISVDIIGGGTDFTKLRKLTRSYLTTLINLGYHSKYIENASRDFFFQGDGEIEGNNDIFNFFALFSSGSKSFSVIYKADTGFSALGNACEVFGVELVEDYASLETPFDEELLPLAENELYVLIKGVEAQDEFSARVIAEKQLEKMVTVHSLFHHKSQLHISSECIVFLEEEELTVLSRSPINTMHKCRDAKPSVAAKKMNMFVPSFRMGEASFQKFNRAAELHSMALDSRFKENQLINLWIALESIVPAKWEGRDISKIKHLINQVLPILTVRYVDRLVDNLLKDLIKRNRRELTVAVSDVSGGSLREKLVKVLALDEYSKKKERLESSLRDYYLLKDRLAFFVESFSSPKAIYGLLENHTTRVSWQIRRIYRARNMIVHSGVTPTYTDILIENTHDYLDIIMRTLMDLTTDNIKVTSIEQGFVYCDIQFTALKNWLCKKDAQFDHENLGKVVGNPLMI